MKGYLLALRTQRTAAIFIPGGPLAGATYSCFGIINAPQDTPSQVYVGLFTIMLVCLGLFYLFGRRISDHDVFAGRKTLRYCSFVIFTLSIAFFLHWEIVYWYGMFAFLGVTLLAGIAYLVGDFLHLFHAARHRSRRRQERRYRKI